MREFNFGTVANVPGSVLYIDYEGVDLCTLSNIYECIHPRS